MRSTAILLCTGLAMSPAAAGSAPAAASYAGPQLLWPAQRDSITQAIEKDRADTFKWLQSGETSYLATVSRVDFGDHAALTVGSAAGSDVHVDDPDMPAHALTVTVAGDSFRVSAIGDTATFRFRDLAYHEATLPPSSIQLGSWTLRLSHQRFPAIIVFDPRSPRLASYHGLAYYPVDLRWRYVAPLTPNPAADTVIILSTRGNARRAIRVGWFELRMGGRNVRLEAHRLLEPGVDENAVSVFFRDATTGHDTYAVGRYVDPERQPDGRWLVDFNAAYNPACAFSPHYNCPIPSKANTLPVAVIAGEKDSHYGAH